MHRLEKQRLSQRRQTTPIIATLFPFWRRWSLMRMLIRIESSIKFNPATFEPRSTPLWLYVTGHKGLGRVFAGRSKEREGAYSVTKELKLLPLLRSHSQIVAIYLSQHKATMSFYSSVAAIILISKIVHVSHYRPAWQRSCWVHAL